MVISLLANIGIILLNIYLLWKIDLDYFDINKLSYKKILMYIGLQTLVGILLMEFAVVILDIHFDFRLVLFALTMKYLGDKVTITTIFLLGMIRLLHEGFLPASLNLVIVFILLLTYTHVFKWSKKHFSSIGQMLTLVYYYLVIAFPLSITLLNDIMLTVIIYSIVLVIATVMIIVIHNVMSDIQYLSNLAVIDNLTNLYNSRKLREDFKRLSNSDKLYALIVIDIDDFKCFNDVHGHLVGDAVIREIAMVLSSLSHENHYCYRYGGEEFVALIEDCSGSKAADLADKIHKRISALRIPTDDGQFLEVTVSIGVAYRLSEEVLFETFKRADNALYKAKENGKDRIVIG